MRFSTSSFSLMNSAQWDNWIFGGQEPLMVVSHKHNDHWAVNTTDKAVVLVSDRNIVPRRFNHLNSIVPVEHSAIVRGTKFIKLDAAVIRNIIGPIHANPHATWWIATRGHGTARTRLLFVGDMNIEDARTIRKFISVSFERNLPLHGAMLPSFGGTLKHGVMYPREMTEAVTELAYLLRDRHDMTLAGLPHPVDAEWADVNATRLQSLADMP